MQPQTLWLHDTPSCQVVVLQKKKVMNQDACMEMRDTAAMLEEENQEYQYNVAQKTLLFSLPMRICFGCLCSNAPPKKIRNSSTSPVANITSSSSLNQRLPRSKQLILCRFESGGRDRRFQGETVVLRCTMVEWGSQELSTSLGGGATMIR